VVLAKKVGAGGKLLYAQFFKIRLHLFPFLLRERGRGGKPT